MRASSLQTPNSENAERNTKRPASAIEDRLLSFIVFLMRWVSFCSDLCVQLCTRISKQREVGYIGRLLYLWAKTVRWQIDRSSVDRFTVVQHKHTQRKHRININQVQRYQRGNKEQNQGFKGENSKWPKKKHDHMKSKRKICITKYLNSYTGTSFFIILYTVNILQCTELKLSIFDRLLESIKDHLIQPAC